MMICATCGRERPDTSRPSVSFGAPCPDCASAAAGPLAGATVVPLGYGVTIVSGMVLWDSSGHLAAGVVFKLCAAPHGIPLGYAPDVPEPEDARPAAVLVLRNQDEVERLVDILKRVDEMMSRVARGDAALRDLALKDTAALEAEAKR